MANVKSTPHTEIEDPTLDVFVWRIGAPIERHTEAHVHSKGQLLSLESGLAIVETVAGSWVLPPQRCGWIPPGCSHGLRSCGNITGWSIYLTPDLCGSLPEHPMVLSTSPLLQQIVLRISEWSDKLPAPIARQHLVSVLLDEIKSLEEQPLHLPMPSDPRLKRLVAEMSLHPDEDRTLEAWAHWVGMSQRSLLRNFQRETGMSIGQWQHHLRMLVALEKLSTGSSVTDTCFAVGYNSVSAFIKAFKRIVGMTPFEYSRRSVV